MLTLSTLRSLFIRFVETLGARDFLSPVTMLLVERAGKTLDETALPVALLENFAIDIQLGVSCPVFLFDPCMVADASIRYRRSNKSSRNSHASSISSRLSSISKPRHRRLARPRSSP